MTGAFTSRPIGFTQGNDVVYDFADDLCPVCKHFVVIVVDDKPTTIKCFYCMAEWTVARKGD